MKYYATKQRVRYRRSLIFKKNKHISTQGRDKLECENRRQ